MPNKPTSPVLGEIFERLFAAYGPQRWWPGETDTEIVVGAILTQNTAWRNVERAIERLKQAQCLSFPAIRDLPRPRLEELVRPSGTYRVKARRLTAFVKMLFGTHGGSLPDMLGGDLDEARRRLTSIHGIGPETADAILLYAADRPTFVVDTYTKRILRRHFLLDPSADYEATRRVFHDELVPDARQCNEFHALFVRLGKVHCRVRARCEGCPLESMPHDAGL